MGSSSASRNLFHRLFRAFTSSSIRSERVEKEDSALSDKAESRLGQSAEGEFGEIETISTGPSRLLSSSSTAPSKFTEDSNIGLKILVNQPADRLDCVDIVALHGLNGHRDLTWTDRVTGLNWLSNENCLSKDIPNARILTFGYNSKTYFSRSKSNVQDFASELLGAISTRRQGAIERKRPLIFICHSLGGLVFKQACSVPSPGLHHMAVIRAHEQDNFYSGILDSIQGVVFFGTPHRGSDLAFWDSVAVSLVRASTLGYVTNSKLSRDLKIEAETLKHISESFVHRGANFGIRSFYETQFMTGLNCLIVEKDSACLNWPNELAIASSAHHSNICKFSDPSSQRYQAAVLAIQELISVSQEQHHVSDLSRPFTSQEERCMRELNSAYEDYLDQVDNPVLGTCKWILKHQEFEWWEAADHSALLWISANPGCGKSVLAKYLIAYLQSSTEDDSSKTNLCYFFFKEGLEEQDNASSAVSALLHQLYTWQHPLIRHALPKYLSTNRRVFNSFSSLWKVFIDSLCDSTTNETICIIDGLDECETKSLAQLLKGIANLFEKTPSETVKFKLLLLSRPHNRMETILCLSGNEETNDHNESIGSANKRRLIGENESKHMLTDIAKFARHKVKQLSNTSSLSADVLNRLDERLLAGADFTFLWISLVMQLIEDAQMDGVSAAELDAILNTNKLDDLYERFLMERTLPLKALKILYLVLAAVRPLTMKELCVAIEVQQDHFLADNENGQQALAELGPSEKYRPEPNQFTEEEDLQPHQGPRVSENAVSSLGDLKRLLRTPFANHLRVMCGNLVCIRNRKIYLVHKTARDFLLRRASVRPIESPSLASPTSPPTGNRSQRYAESKYRGLVRKGLRPGWRHSIRLKDANSYLLHVCANYLSLFSSQPNADREWTRHEVERYLGECRRDPPRAFFQYAASHWTQHYRPLRQQSVPVYTFDYLLQPNDLFFKTWIFVHTSFNLGQEKLEESAKWMHGKAPTGEGDKDQLNPARYYSRQKSGGWQGSDFEKVLNYFFPLDLGMDVYDEEFLAGDHYWKTGEAGSADDASADKEKDEEEDGEADDSDGIPDRVRYYRSQHHKELMGTYADMSNPLSPGGGNPLNSWVR